MEALRFLALGVDFPDLTDAWGSLQSEDRLTATGISFESREWYQGETTDGDVLLGV